MSDRYAGIVDHIGVTIAARRNALGLSLEEVAKRANCTKSHVWEMEKGKSKNPTIKQTLALCEALQCSLNTLLGLEVAQPIITDHELSLIAAHRKIFGAKP